MKHVHYTPQNTLTPLPLKMPKLIYHQRGCFAVFLIFDHQRCQLSCQHGARNSADMHHSRLFIHKIYNRQQSAHSQTHDPCLRGSKLTAPPCCRTNTQSGINSSDRFCWTFWVEWAHGRYGVAADRCWWDFCCSCRCEDMKQTRDL